MIIFVLDACAIARIYFEDIGTRNILQVYNYPDSLLMVPNFAYCKSISAMISALNNRDINVQQYTVAKAGLAYDFNIEKIQDLIVRNDVGETWKSIASEAQSAGWENGTFGRGFFISRGCRQIGPRNKAI